MTASWSEPPIPGNLPGMAGHAPSQEVVAGVGPNG